MKIALFIILFGCGLVSAQTTPPTDNWKPLRALIGTWDGTGNGEAGESKVEREYKFAAGDKFLQATHRSTYAPTTKNPKGLTREDLGIFSYDLARKQIILRQFYAEGFIVQFLISSVSDDGKTIVLNSEINENIPKDMRSRLTYKIVGENELTETYEGAEPGKDFVVYFAKQFKRKK